MAIAEFQKTGELESPVMGDAKVIPLISADLLLPDHKSLRLEDNAWVIRDEGEMIALGGDTEGALMAAYGINKGRRIENTWEAFEGMPFDNLEDSNNLTFGDLFSDMSKDQLKLADIVLELEIVNQVANPDEYAPDQVLAHKDNSSPPIFRVDHATSANEGLSIFFRKIDGQNGNPEYIKLGACSKERRDDAMRLFEKFGYQSQEKPAAEQAAFEQEIIAAAIENQDQRVVIIEAEEVILVDSVEPTRVVAEIAVDEIQPEKQGVRIEEVEQGNNGGVIIGMESARERLPRAKEAWPTPVLRKVPRVQIDPSTLRTPSGIAVSPFMAHLLGADLPAEEKSSSVAATHTVFSRDGKSRAYPSNAHAQEKAGRNSHGHEVHTGETVRVAKGTFPWIREDIDVPVSNIQVGQRRIRLVDVSETDRGFLTASKRRLNGSAPKTDSLARSTVGEAVTNHGIVKGARTITSTAQELPGPIIQRHSNEPNEASRVTVHVTLPRANSDLAYFIAGGPYDDAPRVERTIASYIN